MDIEQYQNQLQKRLGDAKKKILTALWNKGTKFPRGWVASSQLLALTGQKYFDRRVREMRDELGCDIETGIHNGEHCYRLISTNIGIANQRLYLTATQKKQLFQNSEFKCAICGEYYEPGLRGLQADHRIPLIRGGDHKESNWQPLCVDCNVAKRSTCKGCKDDCKKCPYAFPEKCGRVVLLKLPPRLIESVQQKTGNNNSRVNKFIVDAIKSSLVAKNL